MKSDLSRRILNVPSTFLNGIIYLNKGSQLDISDFLWLMIKGKLFEKLSYVLILLTQLEGIYCLQSKKAVLILRF